MSPTTLTEPSTLTSLDDVLTNGAIQPGLYLFFLTDLRKRVEGKDRWRERERGREKEREREREPFNEFLQNKT